MAGGESKRIGRGRRSALAVAALLALAVSACDRGEPAEPPPPVDATEAPEPETPEEVTPLPPPATLEEAAARALGDHDAFIALDPATGEVKALVNPDIAVRGLYPPGSTFKLISAYAALDGGLLGPHDEVSCDGAYSSGGTLHPCSVRKGHGRPNVVRALAESCNVFFYQLGGRLGRDRVRGAVDDFALLEPTGFDPSEPAGEFPDDLPDDQLFLLGAGNLTSVRVTPLSMLVAFSGLVGDGQCRRPWRGDRPRGESRASMPALFEYQALLMDGLEGAVEFGTATSAAVPGETVLGKTGTIRDPDAPVYTVNWFLGYLVERRITACVIQTRAEGVEPAAAAFGTIFTSFTRE
jgi:cell division protein FtsI/penicillin-binding protein 2